MKPSTGTDFGCITHAAADLCIILDEQGVLLSMNPAFEKVLGWPPEMWLGRHLLDLMDEDDQVLLLAEIQAAKESQSRPLPLYLRHADGRQIVLEFSVFGLDEQHFAGIGRDISSRQQSHRVQIRAARDEERKRMLSHFVRDISHDIRTPLSIIGTNAYLALKKLHASQHSEIALHLDKIEASVNALSTQLADILTLTHLESSAADFQCVPHDLNDLARELVQEYNAYAEDAGVSIRLAESPEVVCASIDSDALSRALHQILMNAISHSPRQAEVIVSIHNAEGRAKISIADSGPGMNKHVLSRIFDPFYRADEARGHDNGGMGLGLAIAQNIVAAHNGVIEVESEPGKGSIFTLSLPLVPDSHS